MFATKMITKLKVERVERDGYSYSEKSEILIKFEGDKTNGIRI